MAGVFLGILLAGSGKAVYKRSLILLCNL